MKVNRDRIREQSKQVAEYMKKPKKYQVLWTCPHCGNSHTWWWEDEFEAFDDSVVDMKCDRCDEVTKCRGDGHGYYEPIAESTSVKQRSLEQIDATLDELQTSRHNHFSMLVKLSAKDDELDDLNTDLHNYVRQIEDKLGKLNEDNKAVFDAVNSIAKRLSEVETGEIFDNLSRRMTTAELAIANLEDGVKAETYSDRAMKSKSIIDLIHGTPPPFHDRLREGCELGDMSGETIAKILRFIAVEVEKMLDRSMGGSYTINNFEVSKKLRGLADAAAMADITNIPEYQQGDTHIDDDGVMRVYTGKKWLRVQQNIEVDLEEDEEEDEE
jgi:hypothetical protein